MKMYNIANRFKPPLNFNHNNVHNISSKVQGQDQNVAIKGQDDFRIQEKFMVLVCQPTKSPAPLDPGHLTYSHNRPTPCIISSDKLKKLRRGLIQENLMVLVCKPNRFPPQRDLGQNSQAQNGPTTAMRDEACDLLGLGSFGEIIPAVPPTSFHGERNVPSVGRFREARHLRSPVLLEPGLFNRSYSPRQDILCPNQATLAIGSSPRQIAICVSPSSPVITTQETLVTSNPDITILDPVSVTSSDTCLFTVVESISEGSSTIPTAVSSVQPASVPASPARVVPTATASVIATQETLVMRNPDITILDPVSVTSSDTCLSTVVESISEGSSTTPTAVTVQPATVPALPTRIVPTAAVSNCPFAIVEILSERSATIHAILPSVQPASVPVSTTSLVATAANSLTLPATHNVTSPIWYSLTVNIHFVTSAWAQELTISITESVVSELQRVDNSIELTVPVTDAALRSIMDRSGGATCMTTVTRILALIQSLVGQSSGHHVTAPSPIQAISPANVSNVQTASVPASSTVIVLTGDDSNCLFAVEKRTSEISAKIPAILSSVQLSPVPASPTRIVHTDADSNCLFAAAESISKRSTTIPAALSSVQPASAPASPTSLVATAANSLTMLPTAISSQSCGYSLVVTVGSATSVWEQRRLDSMIVSPLLRVEYSTVTDVASRSQHSLVLSGGGRSMAALETELISLVQSRPIRRPLNGIVPPPPDTNTCGGVYSYEEPQYNYRVIGKRIETIDARIDILPNLHFLYQTKSDTGMINILGSGVFGVVFTATHLPTGKTVAIKSQYGVQTPRIIAEARIMQLLSGCRFVPTFYGLLSDPTDEKNLMLVMEMVGSGLTLQKKIQENTLDEKQSISIVLFLSMGLLSIHAKNVLINDIKDDNIIVFSNGPHLHAKFIDFGHASCGFVKRYGGNAVTNARCVQLAPEVRAGDPTTPSSDIYGLGFVMAQFRMDRLANIVSLCMSPEPDQRPVLPLVVMMLNDLLTKLGQS